MFEKSSVHSGNDEGIAGVNGALEDGARLNGGEKKKAGARCAGLQSCRRATNLLLQGGRG